MTFDSPATIRKISSAVVGSLVLVIFLLACNYFFIQPRVIVQAPVGSTITVRYLDGNQVTHLTTQNNHTTLRPGVGNYMMVVSAQTGKQIFYPVTHLFHSYDYSFTGDRELSTQLVAYTVGYNAVRQGQSLIYLNTTDRSLISLTSQGNITKLAQQDISRQGSGAQGIYPIANNDAVILADNTLWSLHNNQLSRLDTTGFPDKITALTIGCNPVQQSFVIAANQTLYWYASLTAKPQEVTQINKRFDRLVYGGERAIAYSTRMPFATTDIKSAYSNYAVDPILIDTKDRSQQTLTGGPIASASLAPDGDTATITSRDTHATSLLAIRNGANIHQLSTPDAGPWWSSGTSFLYAKNSVIWRYNLASNSAESLAELPSTLAATSLTFDQATGQYYVTTYDSASTAAIYKLSTLIYDKNADRAGTLTHSSKSYAQFDFSYVNLIQPTLIITTRVISNNPTEAQFKSGTIASRQAALQFLKLNNIKPELLTIIYRPAIL